MYQRLKQIRELPLHIMILPALIITLVYCYGPMVGIIIAFQDFKPGFGLFGSKWVGLENFIYIAHLPGTFRVLWNTFYIAFFKIVGMVVVPVIFALLLNEIGSKVFKRFFQTLVYIPYFLSWVIVSGIVIDVLSPSTGILNMFISSLGLKPVFFLGDEKWFPVTLILSDIWKNFGFGTVIYLAALSNIDPSLYESSKVDGANRWKQTVHITIPGIMPIVILMSVLSMGNILNAGFEQVFNLYSPQVYKTGDIIDTFVYRIGMIDRQYGPASAVGFFKSVVSFVFVSLSYKLADKAAGYRIY